MENFWTYFEVLAPSVGVGLIFWLAMRSIFRADRKERAVEAQVRDEYASEQPSYEESSDGSEGTTSASASGQRSQTRSS